MKRVLTGRFMWWAPWSLTRPWLPRAWRGGDEWCNPAVSLVVPPLGAVHWFWRGRTRVMPCAECWHQMGPWQRSSYLPGGYLEGGRVHQDRADLLFAEER